MRPQRRKRIGSAILWFLTYAGIAADSTDRLQDVATWVPPAFGPYLPVVYGVVGVMALLLLRSAHQDDLDDLEAPDISSVRDAQLRHANEIAAMRGEGAELRAELMAANERASKSAPRGIGALQKVTFAALMKEASDTKKRAVRIFALRTAFDSLFLAGHVAEMLRWAGVLVEEHDDQPKPRDVLQSFGIWVFADDGSEFARELTRTLRNAGHLTIFRSLQSQPDYNERENLFIDVIIGERADGLRGSRYDAASGGDLAG